MEKSDPFAHGGLVNEPDAHLFELIAEYRRRWARANERDISDDERAVRCDHADEISCQIKRLRPVTLRGVLAALILLRTSRIGNTGRREQSRGCGRSSIERRGHE